MSKFGLIGKNIGYSFSKSFFTKKFENEGLNHSYENFDVPTLDNLSEIFSQNDDLKGLNVTIPYKEQIIPYLDELDEIAKDIGAVNVIKITENRKLIGYNSDYYGFQSSLESFLPLKEKSALILGTGGASKAVAYVLDKLGFNYSYVSRSKDENTLNYSDLDQFIIKKNYLIINCTPLGTYPQIDRFPPIPYQFLTKDHLLFDLIYNPSETQFLSKGKFRNTKTSNGLNMLQSQAQRAWEIWNS